MTKPRPQQATNGASAPIALPADWTDDTPVDTKLKWLHATYKNPPPEHIGLLPKPTRKENTKGKCDVCGGYHGLPAVHLDYLGHAELTDILCFVDPLWSWEPFSVDADGQPKTIVNSNGGVMWINLTIWGVTRPGVGTSPPKGPDMFKELIGDALRNAAMRFGIGTALWSKIDGVDRKVESGITVDADSDHDPNAQPAPEDDEVEAGGERIGTYVVPDRAKDESARAYRHRILQGYKASQPCADCKGSFPPESMDLDHRPGETKVMNPGNAPDRMGVLPLIEELRKCDIVCSNCHRARTRSTRREPAPDVWTAESLTALDKPTLNKMLREHELPTNGKPEAWVVRLLEWQAMNAPPVVGDGTVPADTRVEAETDAEPPAEPPPPPASPRAGTDPGPHDGAEGDYLDEYASRDDILDEPPDSAEDQAPIETWDDTVADPAAVESIILDVKKLKQAQARAYAAFIREKGFPKKPLEWTNGQLEAVVEFLDALEAQVPA